MARIKVTPNAGRRVRNDLTGEILTAGEAVEVEESIYWHRRAAAGDVEVGKIKAGSGKAPKNAKRASSSSEES